MISNRLRRVTELLKKSDCVADIGTDHAYLPIFLAQNNLANLTFAVDANDEPLNIAKNNVESFKLQKQVRIIKSNGMQFFNQNPQIKLDFTIIAGLGSVTILKILEEWLNPHGKAIICSNTPLSIIRSWIKKQQYKIEHEELIMENHKYYWIMVLSFSYRDKLKSKNLEFGDSKFFKGNNLYKNYLSNEILRFQKIMDNLIEKDHLKKKKEIKHQIKRMEKFINEIT